LSKYRASTKEGIKRREREEGSFTEFEAPRKIEGRKCEIYRAEEENVN